MVDGSSPRFPDLSRPQQYFDVEDLRQSQLSFLLNPRNESSMETKGKRFKSLQGDYQENELMDRYGFAVQRVRKKKRKSRSKKSFQKLSLE